MTVPRVGFRHRLEVALDVALLLQLLLNLIDEHSPRLIVRERLRVIAVASMHPHATGCDVLTAGPRFSDGAGQQRAA